jgi:eukaryotic-like serine/threonine-protein kinase
MRTVLPPVNLGRARLRRCTGVYATSRLEHSHAPFTTRSSRVSSLGVSMSGGLESWGFAEGDEIAPRRRAVRLLGGGNRYEAWLAWDERLRALVVAKLLRPAQARDPAARRGLAAEAAMLGRLSHPLLVRSFGAELDGARPHLVLEFVEGPRLSTLIRRFGLILEQVVPLALNLCSALHYLAESEVVHLDVKPRNIIMAGSPRLIDLSVARRVEEVGSLHGPVGTDAYMAPEQCDPDRRAEIGPPSDVWGLGVTVHEAFTGRLPYPRPSAALRYPQLAHPPRLDEGVPPKLRHLLLSCLERRPADRPRAGDLGDALEPFVAALPAPRIGRFRPGGKQLVERLEAS